jgi:alkanesulfonate monooxygenase SsuD/methylene tetrahydromethanopterin reductase-like flavin-dependent oxidoreductase (luciferase family)
VKQAVAAPCFGDDPRRLIELAVRSEDLGFDGFFVWDHLHWSDEVDGPDVLDPWTLLAGIAASTRRIRIGPMITPVSRRRPWVLAKQCTTLDRLSGGRLTLGVGLGAPAFGDFGRFGDATDPRERAELLDEGLEVWAGLCSGRAFSFKGRHFTIASTRFRPAPIQRPRIPVWVGGVLPARRPLERAARWDGAVPIRYVGGRLTRPRAEDIAETRAFVAARREVMTGYDLVVWSELLTADEDAGALVGEYARAGATWWIETGRPGSGWLDAIDERVERGPIGLP